MFSLFYNSLAEFIAAALVIMHITLYQYFYVPPNDICLYKATVNTLQIVNYQCNI